MTEVSEPDAADAKWKLQREEEEWTRERDSELEKRVPPDKASGKELMFKGQGELGKGGPRKMEQPPTRPRHHANMPQAGMPVTAPCTDRVSFPGVPRALKETGVR